MEDKIAADETLQCQLLQTFARNKAGDAFQGRRGLLFGDYSWGPRDTNERLTKHLELRLMLA